MWHLELVQRGVGEVMLGTRKWAAKGLVLPFRAFFSFPFDMLEN